MGLASLNAVEADALAQKRETRGLADPLPIGDDPQPSGKGRLGYGHRWPGVLAHMDVLRRAVSTPGPNRANTYSSNN